MLNEFAKEWIIALRSGLYKQCQHYYTDVDLEGNRSFCCLGVALDILDLPLSDRGAFAPTALLEKKLPQLIANQHALWHELVRMNDSGSTFLEIADYLEQQLTSNSHD